MTCKFQSVLSLTDSKSALSILSSAPSYLLPESLWNVWSLASSLSNNTTLSFQWVPGYAGLPGNEKADLLAKTGASLPTDAIPSPLPPVWSLASSLSNNTTLSFQWVPGHAGLPGNEKADLLAKTGASLPTDAIPSPLPPVIAKVRYSQYRNWRRHISHSHLNFQVSEVSSEELLLSRSIRSELSRLRCHGHSLLLSSYLHRISRKENSDCSACGTLYRTSIISSSTVLLLNPFANLFLAPLSLFSIYGPDSGVWPDCWVSAEFLRAPIPRKRSGSTTTTSCTMCIKLIFLNNFTNLTSDMLLKHIP